MKKGEIRIFVVIVSLVLSLAVLWTGFNLYTKYILKAPAIKELERRQEIETVKINGKKPYKVVVKLGEVDNLMEVYNGICSVLDDRLGEQNYALIVEDKSNPGLKEVYYLLQPAIYEAIEKNAYTWLINYLNKELACKGLSYKLFVDDDNLYLQIRQEEGGYLYAVISRQNKL